MPSDPNDEPAAAPAQGESDRSASGSPVTSQSAPGGMIFNGPVNISGGQVGPALHAGASPDQHSAPSDEAALFAALRDHARKRTRLPELFRVRGGPDAFEEVEVELAVSTDLDATEPSGPFPIQQDTTGRFLRGEGLPAGRFPLRDLLTRPEYRWVILGIPGSGKTTCLRRLGRQIAEEQTRIPLILRIDEVASADKVLESIAPGASAPFWHAAGRGQVAVLVDSLDEATDPVAARQSLDRLSTRLGRSLLIVSSRAAGYRPLSGAHDLRLCPLERQQQIDLLKRWLPSSRHNEIVPALDGLGARMKELAGNPLILTLMGRLMRESSPGQRALPRSRVDLYRRVVDGLLTRGHDAEVPGPHRFDDSEGPVAVLGWLALDGFGDGRDALGRAAIHTRFGAAPALVQAALADMSLDLWLGRVVAGAALLEKEQGGGWSFAHRTFREYLAAAALRDDVVARGGVERCGLGSELDRRLSEAKAKPALWAEVFALLTGILTGDQPEALVQRLVDGGADYKPLLFRVLADAEGLKEETVWGVLGLAAGRGEWQERSEVLKGLPALVGDLGVAVKLLWRFAKWASHGADLWWTHHLLVEIAEGRLGDGDEEACSEAQGLAGSLFQDHRPEGRKRALALIEEKGWWKAIPVGRFLMGSTKETDPDRHDDEGPQHEVEITCGFKLLAVPVTNALYEFFDPDHHQDRHTFSDKLPLSKQEHVPVYNVSWYEASAFALWLGCRLPSETEWEYACRGGTTTRFWSGTGDQDLFDVGWVGENSGGHPHPVATPPKKGSPQHPWGLHDLHGNVWEWCADPWVGDYQDRAVGVTHNPNNLMSSNGMAPFRVARGGSNDTLTARSAYRTGKHPSGRVGNQGFRLLRLLPES